jgi:hypothetical protein
LSAGLGPWALLLDTPSLEECHPSCSKIQFSGTRAPVSTGKQYVNSIMEQQNVTTTVQINDTKQKLSYDITFFFQNVTNVALLP